MFGLLLLLNASQAIGQYVHPNQAGRRGGDTGAGIGTQVVTTTYIGNVGNVLGQGTMIAVNKDGTNSMGLSDFAGYPTDGSYPFYTTPIQASDGSIYGPSYVGGSANLGAIYKYDLSGGLAACSKSVIYNNAFIAGAGASYNYANINELSDGKLYCIQTTGGTNYVGRLYSINKDGSGMTIIHDFRNAATPVTYSAAAAATRNHFNLKYDGTLPYGFVVEGPDGKIYGTTYVGGSNGLGTVYRCNKDGSSYEIIAFGSSAYYAVNNASGTGTTNCHGAFRTPIGNVAIDQTGKVYVAGYTGGALNTGALTRMNADGSSLQLVKTFDFASGYYPYRGPLIIDGQVYGTTRYGGSGTSIGTVWKVDLNGGNYAKLKMFDATGGYADGAEPWAGLSYDGTNLYGTTIVYGGIGKVGTMFKISPAGTGFQTIHRFSNTAGAVCGVGSKGLFSYYPSAERVTFANVTLGCAKTCVENKAPCAAGTTLPTLSVTSLANVCPATTGNLSTVTATNTPANTVLTWHTATPATALNKMTNITAVSPGTYYASFYDAANLCYSTVTKSLVVTAASCAGPFAITLPAVQNKTPLQAGSGNAATELAPSGGVGAYTYSDGVGAAGCTAPAGAAILPATSNLNITGSGTYTYTAPTLVGKYYFCVKVCDSSATPQCSTATYTVIVASACDTDNTVAPVIK
jgi:uncharacterized repeat protein (TIGR03803 family)